MLYHYLTTSVILISGLTFLQGRCLPRSHEKLQPRALYHMTPDSGNTARVFYYSSSSSSSQRSANRPTFTYSHTVTPPQADAANTTDASSKASSSTPTQGSDQEKWLAEHNKVRAQYGSPALTWSSSLETFAKGVTDRCVFEHTVNNQHGENLAAGQATIEDVVKDWYSGPDEKSAYNPSAPQYSHFTQLVWASTRQLGCALTSCQHLSGASLPQSPVNLWVCEYDPPGNVEGEYAQNVKAGQGGAPLSG